MRRCLLLVVAAGLLAAAQPASAEGLEQCTADGSKTVRSTHKVRVYWWQGTLYGCVRASGVKRELFREPRIPNEIFDVGFVRVAGYRVGWVVTDVCTVCGDPGPFSSIYVEELRSGASRALHRVRHRPDGSNLGTRVDAMVLDRCGRVAYRAVLDSVYAHDSVDPDPELHTWVGKVRRRVDRGDIERRSIRLEPDSVHWVRDDEERSAPLAPHC